MGSAVLPHGWIRSPLLVVVAIVLTTLGAAGCSDADSQTGRGPTGSIGPTGHVGEETGLPGPGHVTIEPKDVAGFDRIVFRSEGVVIIAPARSALPVVEADGNSNGFFLAPVMDGPGRKVMAP